MRGHAGKDACATNGLATRRSAMPVVTETQEPRRKPRRWFLVLGVAPAVLLLMALAFLAWLPNRGEKGVPIGRGWLSASFSTSYDPTGYPEGISSDSLGDGRDGHVDFAVLRIKSIAYTIYFYAPHGGAGRSPW
jgi:hypothetical protein